MSDDLDRLRARKEDDEWGNLYWHWWEHLPRPDDCRTRAERLKAEANYRALEYAKQIKELDGDTRKTLRQWVKALDEAGIKPTEGGKWHPQTVARVLDRLEELEL